MNHEETQHPTTPSSAAVIAYDLVIAETQLRRQARLIARWALHGVIPDDRNTDDLIDHLALAALHIHLARQYVPSNRVTIVEAFEHDNTPTNHAHPRPSAEGWT